MKYTATILAAGLMALTAAPAHAAHGSYLPSSWSGPQWRYWQAWRSSGYEPYHRHRRHGNANHGRLHRHYGTTHHGGSGNLIARSGARASVSAVARPHFQCLVDRLEVAGYRIDFMGGFARRSNPSAHPTGNAVDINQTGFGRVTRRFPGNVEEMCRACGVYSGTHFGDYGHFELLHKYGYVYPSGWHHHYASRRRYGHQHYAYR